MVLNKFKCTALPQNEDSEKYFSMYIIFLIAEMYTSYRYLEINTQDK